MTSPRFLLPTALVVTLLAGCAQIDSSPATPLDIAALDLQWEAFEAVPAKSGAGMKRTAIHPVPATDHPASSEFWLEPGSHLVFAKLGGEHQGTSATIPLRSDVARRYRVDFQQQRRKIQAVVWDITNAAVDPTLVTTVTATSPRTISGVSRTTYSGNGVANEATPAKSTEFNPPPSLLFPTN